MEGAYEEYGGGGPECTVLGLSMGAVETLRPFMGGNLVSGRSVFSLSNSKWLMDGSTSLTYELVLNNAALGIG